MISIRMLFQGKSAAHFHLEQRHDKGVIGHQDDHIEAGKVAAPGIFFADSAQACLERGCEVQTPRQKDPADLSSRRNCIGIMQK